MSVKEKVSEVTERGPVVAHALRMVQHYGAVQAKLHSGAITFFGFLSLFPLLALTVFAVGIIARVYPDADEQILGGLNSALPGVSLDQVRTFGGSFWTAVAGLGGVLFTGLGFIQVLRTALMFVFEVPLGQPSFLRAKIADFFGLITVGGTLLVSILLGGVLTRLSGLLLGLVGLDDNLSWLLTLLGLAVGFGVSIVLFFVMFRQLGRSQAPARALWGGALLGAIGFEVLKQLAATLIRLTSGNPAFQAFGIALVVLVLMNYFARLTLYAAAWAHTSPSAIAARPAHRGAPVQGPQLPYVGSVTGRDEASRLRRAATPFAVGGAAMLALVAALKRRDES